VGFGEFVGDEGFHGVPPGGKGFLGRGYKVRWVGFLGNGTGGFFEGCFGRDAARTEDRQIFATRADALAVSRS
jgi:hypothetical protein